MIWLCAALHWVLLHGPDNQSYWVNGEQVTTLRAPIPADLQGAFPRGTRCIVVTTSGKFVAVTESCEQVYSLIVSGR